MKTAAKPLARQPGAARQLPQILAKLLERDQEHGRLLDALEALGVNVDALRLDLLELAIELVGLDPESDLAELAYAKWLESRRSRRAGAVLEFAQWLLNTQPARA